MGETLAPPPPPGFVDDIAPPEGFVDEEPAPPPGFVDEQASESPAPTQQPFGEGVRQALPQLPQDIGRGFVRGMGGVISSVGGAVAMLPEAGGMGDITPRLVKDVYRTAGDWITGAGKALTGVVNAPKTGTFEYGNPTWWAEKLPEVLPQIAAQLGLAYATKGQSAKTQLAAFAASGGAQMAGSTYNEAKEDRLKQGEDEETASKGAATEATIVGSIGALLEAIPGAEYLTKGPIGKIVSKVIRNQRAAGAVAGGITEPLTEMTQELVAIGAASVARGKEFTADEIKQRLGAAGALGHGVGLTVGAATAQSSEAVIAQAVDADLAQILSQPPDVAVEDTQLPPETALDVPEPTAADAVVAPVEEPPTPTPPTQPTPEQPPPVPPKEAPPEAPSDQSPTGIRNAIVDEERVTRGLPERMAPLHRTFGKLWDEAMTKADKDPQAGSKLVAEIAENPRPLEDWESALLAHEQVTRQNAFDNAVEAVNANPGNAESAAALTIARDDVHAIYDAGQKAGTKSGQSLAARKLLVNDDYSLAKMEAVTRAVVNDGKPLTTQQVAEVAALHKRIAETEKKLTDLEAKETERVSQDAFESLLKDLKGAAKTEAKAGKTLTDFLDTQADKARARIRVRGGRLNVGINPAELADHVIIGASHIAKGITTLADFTVRMVKEFGEAIRPHLPDIFSKAQNYHTANAQLFNKTSKGEKKPVDIKARAKAESVAGEELSHKTVYDLARAHINAGVHGEAAVMKAVHKDVQEFFPEMTERDVRRAFSEYGKVKFPSKEADKVELAELRTLTRLQESIDRMTENRDALHTGLQREKATQAIREKQKTLNELLKKRTGPPSPEKLASRDEAKQTALRNAIADLDKRLQTGDKPAQGLPTPDSPAVEALRAERDAMKEKLDEIEKPPKSADETRLDSDKKAIATRTRKLQEKIAAGDYTRPVKKEPLMDDAKVSLMFENKKAKEDYARGLFEADLAKRNVAQKILGGVSEVVNTSKAIMTAVDLSAVGRQGGFIAFGNPVRAARAIPDMIRALLSEKASFRAMEQIKQRENAKSGLYDHAKLFLSDDTTANLALNLKKLEEQFNSRWATNIPVVAGSGRAFNTFLNRLRADSFDAMVASLAKGAKPTIEEAKAVANFVNVATGRGTVGSNPALGAVFFAPKLVASRFQLIGGQPFYKGTLRTKLLIAKEYGKFLTGIAAMYALAAAFSDKDDKEPVIELDRRSSDFGKIRIGNTRIDPLVGLAQVSVLLTRVVKGEKKTLKGAIVPLTGDKVPYRGDTTTSILGRFARTKFSPIVGAIVNAREGQNVVGEKTTLGKEALSLVAPLSLRDVYDVVKEHGVPVGTALTVVSLFGFGMQNYSERKPAKAADGT